MGAEQGKPLYDWSPQDVAEGVRSLGKRYDGYVEDLIDNGVDGKLLVTLSDDEFVETLEDLAITNRLHQRKLKTEFLQLKQIKTNIENVHPTEAKAPRRRNPVIQAAKTYQVLPEDIEKRRETEKEDCLLPFDEVAGRLFQQLGKENKLSARYAGVHLFRDVGSHVSLGSRYIEPATHKLKTKPLHLAHNSLCYELFAQAPTEDFVSKDVPPGQYQVQEPGKASQYAGHVITNSDGESVGVVCSLVDVDNDGTNSSLTEVSQQEQQERHQARKELLQQMAQEAERLLQARSLLLERNRLVREHIEDLVTKENENRTPTEPAGEAMTSTATTDSTTSPTTYQHLAKLRPITEKQVAVRENEIFAPPASTVVPKRTMAHPLVQKMQASKAELEELGHLPPDFFKTNDDDGVDHAPIPKNDLERVAALERVGIKNLTPDHPTFQSLRGLVDLGAKLLGTQIGLLTYLDQEGAYGTCPYMSEQVPQETLAFFATTYPPYKFDSDTGMPYCFKGPRCVAQCNIPTTTGKTFTVPDLWEDESYPHSRNTPGAVRFYMGTPIYWRGLPVASLCLLDPEPKFNIGALEELQLEQIAGLMTQHIENFAIEKETERLEAERKRLSMKQEAPDRKSKNQKPPEGRVALVFTDIQGSTRLWEADPTAMHKALHIHDEIMRKHLTMNYGFEITTEGDAFQIAFHDSIDAIRFALAVQEDLQKAAWSTDFLSLPDGRDDGCGTRGARVRMAIHCGDISHRENAVSGRREYYGDTAHITKALEDMAHGGQISVTSDVWNAVSYVAETTLGAPQVVDLGEHVVRRGKHHYEGVISMGVVQVVPSTLAYDFFAHRVSDITDEVTSKSGRLFAPPITKKQMSPSFFDAPYLSNRVTMLFLYTTEVEKSFDDAASILSVLAQLARHLIGTGPGYQCKSMMFAFPSPSDAIEYGNRLQETLRQRPVQDSNLDGMIKIGIHEGHFTSMGPHRTTGRADYFGKVVNRAARVAGAAEPGDICLGRLDKEIPTTEGCEKVNCVYLGSKLLSGMDDEMHLFSCKRLL